MRNIVDVFPQCHIFYAPRHVTFYITSSNFVMSYHFHCVFLFATSRSGFRCQVSADLVIPLPLAFHVHVYNVHGTRHRYME